ncbi:hypothetical protein AVEN_144850-1 [Araneus ventricosus]|uniref:Integrase catalytic domain-containing protein n=1 Tax=Araneus ventricosus TaxID=182803 RepID=A0A4Y2NI29_ARAVE|nr:hypothetical protein AVEN_144850-1 [Araneus ventricosus]
MNSFIKNSVQSYQNCQRSKIQRHTKSPIGTFSLSDARFVNIKIDFIGLLPPSDGTNRIRTTSYHPQSNGLVERFHRHLKNSIIAHSQPKWTETLPVVLLGIRSAKKPDINATYAELVYGTSLRLPSDILNSKSDLSTPTDTYVSKFKSIIQSINPISTSRHSIKPIYIHPPLQTWSHVFLRTDSVKPSLSPPYTGPHPVISRNEKTFVLKINDKNISVSIDRIYPAYMLPKSSDTLVSTYKPEDEPSP